MTLLSPATDWTGQTNAERAEECARFLAVHGFIEVSECERICDEARERGERESGL